MVRAAEVLRRVPLVKACCSPVTAVGRKSSAGTGTSVSPLETTCIAGAAPQADNLPGLWDLLNASEESFP